MVIIYYIKRKYNQILKKYTHTSMYIYYTEQKYVRLYIKILIALCLQGIERGSFIFHFFFCVCFFHFL